MANATCFPGLTTHMRQESRADDAGAQGHGSRNEALRQQQPRPRSNEHKAPNDVDTKQKERTLVAEGWTTPTILLLALNGHKQATRTVQRHHTLCAIPKHNAKEANVAPFKHDDQGAPRTCWYLPHALDIPWPLPHLISPQYHTSTAAHHGGPTGVALPLVHPQDALHIVKQESHCYALGNGRAGSHAKHRKHTRPWSSSTYCLTPHATARYSTCPQHPW